MLGSGATVAFATTTWAADIISVDSLTVNGESIDTSHLLTSNGSTPAGGTSVPGKIYKIEASLTVVTDPGTVTPLLQDPETITITWSDSSVTSFSGYMTSVGVGAATNDDRVTSTIAITGTGNITGLVDHS